MHSVDHLLMLLLFVVQPVAGVIEARRYEAMARAGRDVDRARFYRHTALIEWTFLAVLAAAWLSLGRPIEALGFVAPGGPGFWIGAGLLVVMAGLLTYSLRGAKRATEAERTRQVESLGRLALFVPRTRRELQGFYRVSLTAGIVEEIVYRGFVLWYLAHFMPLWGAVALSTVAFGIGHGYQGPNGALRAGAVGFAFALFYVGTGSIWLPIVAHVLLDVLQGAALFELMNPRGALRGAGAV